MTNRPRETDLQMRDLQQLIVDDHIGDLRREGEALRAERRRSGDHPAERDVGAVADTPRPAAIPVRVRFGHWLIGVGAAVAGPGGDHADGPAGHAA